MQTELSSKKYVTQNEGIIGWQKLVIGLRQVPNFTWIMPQYSMQHGVCEHNAAVAMYLHTETTVWMLQKYEVLQDVLN
jgi:hypothetical protein